MAGAPHHKANTNIETKRQFGADFAPFAGEPLAESAITMLARLLQQLWWLTPHPASRNALPAVAPIRSALGTATGAAT
ncbi:hypothetical protein HPT27_04015 [Permianibacter sp. IMCC34836]|uniref:hypothetical protein n=1 Tax=Permianibacter fluminis TaxID=2738515 RepID=UPI001555C66A|nr:hypothetical protein [Permianibacter fluminis]NQD36178.1 hypothetical protein [Permianibacter fluminis]